MIRDALTISTFLALCMAGPIALTIAGRWLMRRSEDNAFADNFVPSRASVVAAEHELGLVTGRSA